MNPTVLLMTANNWVPTARLAIALRNAGFRVHALCPPRHPISDTKAASRIHTYHGLAPLRSLKRAIAQTKPDIVVPGDDLSVRHLHDLYQSEMNSDDTPTDKQEVRSSVPSPVAALIERSLGSPSWFSTIDARAAFIELARTEGIRIPETKILNNSEDLNRWMERVGLPTVLKSDGSSGGEGVRLVRTSDEARQAFQSLGSAPLLARALKRAALDYDSTLVWPSLLRQRSVVNAQMPVRGHEATSTIACWKGTVLASLHFEVLRKSHAAGHATVVRLIENRDMSEAAEKMVRRMGLSGLCGFDFMLEANTGNAYLIELNPRATQVGHLTLGSGRDLPAALYEAVSGHESAAQKFVRPSLKVTPALTNNNTIALFPHEWARDPESDFLRSAYHDVPWETPDLVDVCIRRSRRQRAWYSRSNRDQAAMAPPPEPNRSTQNCLAESRPRERGAASVEVR